MFLQHFGETNMERQIFSSSVNTILSVVCLWVFEIRQKFKRTVSGKCSKCQQHGGSQRGRAQHALGCQRNARLYDDSVASLPNPEFKRHYTWRPRRESNSDDRFRSSPATG